jgi:hypothetical protein
MKNTSFFGSFQERLSRPGLGREGPPPYFGTTLSR